MYKLTDENGQTGQAHNNNTQWGENVTHTTSGEGELCTSGWIHVYDDPILAVILNPIHTNFESPRLWECECTGAMKEDRGLKFGVSSCTTLKEIPLPEITINQKIAFEILCSLEVYKSKSFEQWANNWLTGADRSARVTEAAAAARVEWAAAAAVEVNKRINFKSIIKKAMEIK